MNSALSNNEVEPLLERECALLKTIGKLVRKDPAKSHRLADLAEITGLSLVAVHRAVKALQKKGRLEVEKVSGMRFTVKDPG